MYHDIIHICIMCIMYHVYHISCIMYHDIVHVYHMYHVSSSMSCIILIFMYHVPSSCIMYHVSSVYFHDFYHMSIYNYISLFFYFLPLPSISFHSLYLPYPLFLLFPTRPAPDSSLSAKHASALQTSWQNNWLDYGIHVDIHWVVWPSTWTLLLNCYCLVR